MNTPFVYGKLPQEIDFTDREREIVRLKNNFNSLINTVIISPRRWGKTSLVKMAALSAIRENRKLKIVHLDIFNIRSEYEFYLLLVNEVLKATSSGWDELVKNTRLFLKQLIPQVSFSPDKQSQVSFSIGWDELQKHPDDILNLAENIAIKKDLNIIICIDEFQNIASFEHPDAFQRKLRAHWQTHQKTAYCLYGSKQHMLMDVFSNYSMPFYKFGDIMFLEKIPAEDWVLFIQKRFTDTKKEIPIGEAEQIAVLADNHSYYVQQLAQQVWFRTAKRATPEIVESAFEDIISQLSLLFVNMTDSLSKRQLSLLNAILNNENQLTSKATLAKYNLGTSANVIQLKKRLIELDIIDEMKGQIQFLDPMYKHWLATRYFTVR
ncbi:MAG TPA: ATP-binding protein [Petrimonas sp.]|uniref:AAA family ATPase n=1 Tax=Petrimonas sp. TaxID=2023866 RepID=UPI00176A81E1|nr:ATP-binding protein [Petrimonas sp.]